ncbi:TM2 domain-containing protein [Streptomyces pini]|uniref:TM2 domain-containing protein n=1 Tax=Streptomyces pini TaxID=1520580 RepID=A0A1I4I8X2_9ACTN|nr:TM2 domain-containing protein [Streptomyces pini]SFL50832.1 TM2 domain-containing protein [Streptomyces pini]
MSDPSSQNPYGQPQQPQNNPYAQQPGQPGQPAYGYPQQPGQPGQPGYGYPQQPGQPEYGYPQQTPPPAAGGYTGDPNAPYGYDPYGRPYSDKSKVVAGVLSLFLGGFGIGRFYTGHTGLALGQLFTCGGCGIWSLIDGIMLLTQDSPTDAQGRVLRS